MIWYKRGRMISFRSFLFFGPPTTKEKTTASRWSVHSTPVPRGAAVARCIDESVGFIGNGKFKSIGRRCDSGPQSACETTVRRRKCRAGISGQQNALVFDNGGDFRLVSRCGHAQIALLRCAEDRPIGSGVRTLPEMPILQSLRGNKIRRGSGTGVVSLSLSLSLSLSDRKSVV